MKRIYELNKGKNISIKGEEAANSLKYFKNLLNLWGIPLPETDPLVLDFGLHDFCRTGLIESWICNEKKAGYCAKYLFVIKGQSCPVHKHKNKHETFFVLKGSVKMQYNGKNIIMREGDVLPVPEGIKHGFTGNTDCLLLEISKPCVIRDNYFEDKRIKIN